mmetsp:Transcript_10567/g.24737  ORF Transcript_10567/g.24737 Transcript_10567/m.24737 type:complete len:283 (-) Transcript_10567:98-946(-)
MINTTAEALAPKVERLTGGRVALRILSNLADRRLARATVSISADALGEGGHDGAEVARGIAAAYRFAYADPHRAATHNKGIMNGIDAVALATGNDWRALEAGVHAFASRSGQYRPVSWWRVGPDGGLRGGIEVPMQVGIVGGTSKLHPTAQANLACANVQSADQLAMVSHPAAHLDVSPPLPHNTPPPRLSPCPLSPAPPTNLHLIRRLQAMAAIGLVQNLAALRALSTEGIQRGHMSMHARSLAATAGASTELIPLVAQHLIDTGDFSASAAAEALRKLTQ